MPLCQENLRRQLDLQRGRTLSLEEEVAQLKANAKRVSKTRVRELEAQLQRLHSRPAAQGTFDAIVAGLLVHGGRFLLFVGCGVSA